MTAPAPRDATAGPGRGAGAAGTDRSRRSLVAALPAAAVVAGCTTRDGPGPRLPAVGSDASGEASTAGAGRPAAPLPDGLDRLDADQRRRLGFLTSAHTLPTLAGGRATTMRAAGPPMPLPSTPRPLPLRWRADGRELGVDGYFERQPVMALLVVKDGVLRFERYQFGCSAGQHYLSNSMAKTVTALAVGFALQEGRLRSLDDRADAYVPALTGSAYGATTVRNLLRMASGVRFRETYDDDDDRDRFYRAMIRGGGIEAALQFDRREVPQGTRMAYASVETYLLSAVLRGATGEGLSAWLQPRLWQPMGAAHDAYWRTDRTGIERGEGNLSVRPDDYARLGTLLAYDGVRPDTGRRVLPAGFLAAGTDATRVDPAFRPDPRTGAYGYGYQVWLLSGVRRQFVLLGVFGQAIFVDPGLRLAMVHLAVNRTHAAGRTTMGRERHALWDGLVRTFTTDPRA
jgi:CubicO group peptidase (beta-lactamase class C family)